MYMNIQCFIVLNGNGVEVTFLSLNYWENNWCKDCHGSVESFDWCELVWVCYLGKRADFNINLCHRRNYRGIQGPVELLGGVCTEEVLAHPAVCQVFVETPFF